MPTFFRSGGAEEFNDELLFHTGEIFTGFGGSLPTGSLGMRDAQVVKNTKYEMVDQRFYRPWPVIEARAGRYDVRAGPSETQHILEMNRVVWGFARNENQSAPFFECHVSRAMDQIGPSSRGNRSQGSHGAGYNHHSFLWMRTR